MEKSWFFFNSSPICPHNISFQTLSLYFLFDMSYNSSHLHTNSINFSFTSDEQEALVACKHSKCSGGDAGLLTLSESQVQTGSDTFRHVKHSRSATATERNWDVMEMFLSVWTSPFNYTLENWTVTFRDGTETWRIAWIGPDLSLTFATSRTLYTATDHSSVLATLYTQLSSIVARLESCIIRYVYNYYINT